MKRTCGCVVMVALGVGACEGKPGLLTDFSPELAGTSGAEATSAETEDGALTSTTELDGTGEAIGSTGDGGGAESSGEPETTGGLDVLACAAPDVEVGEVALSVTFDPPVAEGAVELGADCWVFALAGSFMTLECDVTSHGVESQVEIEFSKDPTIPPYPDKPNNTVQLFYIRATGQNPTESVVVRDALDGSVWFAAHEGLGPVPDLDGEDVVGEVDGFFAPFRFEPKESDCEVPPAPCGEVRRTGVRFTHDEDPLTLTVFDHQVAEFGPNYRIKVGTATQPIGECDGVYLANNDFMIVQVDVP